MLDQLGQIVGIAVHVVAVPGLGRTAVAAAIVRDYAEAMFTQELHLAVPGIGAERDARFFDQVVLFLAQDQQ